MPQEQAGFERPAPRAPIFRFSPRANRAGEIFWQPWAPETFQKAAREDKPLLLNLTAIWCHWCHVMDETTYSDPEIIRLVNEELVPVRVDADQNPHIQDRYLAGGWPTNSFLTPDGEVLFSGTYIPPDQMLASIQAVLKAWHEDRERLMERLREVEETRRAREEETPKAGTIPPDALDHALRAVERAYDTTYGGFGRAPKFPAFEAVELLETVYMTQGDRPALDKALHTLKKMSEGEIRDRIEGGFFRYATRRDWSEPHYEKMLEGNAGMISNLLDAWRATREDWLADTVREAAGYAVKTLSASGAGGFFGSQDADESYYRADREGRTQMTPPLVDDTIHCDWNGRMCRSLIAAGVSLDQGDWVQRALGTLRFIGDSMMADSGALRHYFRHGRAGGPIGLLADQCEVGWAFLTAFEAAGDRRHLSHAKALAAFMTHSLEDTGGGGFFGAPEEPGALGRLRVREKPFEANALAARFLWRLSAHLGDDWYAREARRSLEWFAPEFKNWGHLGAQYGLAAAELLAPPTRVAILTTSAESGAELLRAAWCAPIPAMVIHPLHPGEELEWGSETFPAHPSPSAYVCVGRECRGPATTPDQLLRLLTGRARH